MEKETKGEKETRKITRRKEENTYDPDYTSGAERIVRLPFCCCGTQS